MFFIIIWRKKTQHNSSVQLGFLKLCDLLGPLTSDKLCKERTLEKQTPSLQGDRVFLTSQKISKMRQSWRGKCAPSPGERNDVSEQRSWLCACISCSVLGCSASACSASARCDFVCPAGARFTPQQYLVKEAGMFGFFRAASGVSSPSRSFTSARRGLEFKAS